MKKTTSNATHASRHRQRAIRWIGAALMILLPTAIAVGASGQVASAGAYGCSYFGAVQIQGAPFPIYNGSECVKIEGSGTYVQGVNTSFAAAGNVCNWKTTAEFFDSNGRWYA